MGNATEPPHDSTPPEGIFGDTLRRLRREAGLTQVELAELASLSPRGLSDLERGINHSPRRDTLLALADALKLGDAECRHFFAAARRGPASMPTTSLEPQILGSEPAAASQIADIQVFLIADVRGYTSYTYEHQDEDAAELTLRFAAIAGAVVQSHSGEVLEVRGDEVLALFTSARAALRAAVALQEQLARISQTTPEQPVRCGIGIEAGETVPVPGGYRGLAINLAARLCSKAAPGEILAGETVVAVARKVDGLLFHDLGLAYLKGIAEPVRVTQVMAANLATVEVPGQQPENTYPQSQVRAGERTPPVGNYLSARPAHRLVARDGEMSRLLALLDAVQSGTGRFVTLVGEPGVGKTRLAQEVLRAAQDRNFLGITGRCYAPQSTVPYYPFLEALARAHAAAPLAIRSSVPIQWPDLERLIPEQKSHSELLPHGAMSSSADQQRLFWQVTRFLEALADERPLALLLDDLQWIDDTSLDLLLHLVRQTRADSILLLGTFRDSDVPWNHPLASGLRDVSRAHLLERVEVATFSPTETAELLTTTLEDWLPGEPAAVLDEQVTDLIYQPTEGNAFFVQETLRALIERGDVIETGGRWTLRAEARVVLPEDARATILERVARLSSQTQQILALASVLGQSFLFDDLLVACIEATPILENITWRPAETRSEPVSETDVEAAVEAALEEAVTARLVRELRGARCAFSHALTQRALYEHMSQRRRQRLHRAAASALTCLPEQERQRRVSDIAYHFLHAEDQDHALPFVLQAGKQAEAIFAHAEATRQFRQAIHLARQLGERATEAYALEQLADALWGTGDFREMIERLEEAAKIHREDGNLDNLAWVISMLTRPYNVLNQVDAAWAHMLELLEFLAPPEPGEGKPDVRVTAAPASIPGAEAGQEALAGLAARAMRKLSSRSAGRLYLSIGVCLQFREFAEQSIPYCEQAIRYTQAAGERWVEVRARNFLSGALEFLGEVDRAVEVLKPAVHIAQAIGDMEGAALVNGGLAEMYLGKGELEAAAESIQSALDAARSYSGPDVLSQLLDGSAQVALYRGAWDETIAYCLQATATAEQFGLQWPAVTAKLLAGLVYLYRGEAAAARSNLDYVMEWFGPPETAARADILLVSVYTSIAEAELLRGQAATARDRLEPWCLHAKRFERASSPLLPMLAWAELELGEAERSSAQLSEAIELAEARGYRLALVESLAVQARLSLARGRHAEAEAILEKALTLARRIPLPYAVAKLLYIWGKLDSVRGDPQAAGEHFAQALQICASLGERLYAEQIEQDQARLDAPGG